MRAFLLGLLIALAGNAALAECSSYTDAVNAYNRGDYGTSITLLNTAINGADSKNASAYYYLASAYLQLGNKKAALEEYRLSLKLAPQGQSAKFCKQAIDHLTGVKSTETSKSASIKVTTGSKPTDEKSKEYPVIKISGLPAIPSVIKDDGPSLSEILLWPLNQQSAYYLTAFNRKN